MISPLRRALAASLGQPLTPQLAAWIEQQCAPVQVTHRFEPQNYKGYVFAVERFADIETEMHPLHVAHYAETEKHKAGIALNGNYDYLKAAEYVGKMLQFTMRHDGLLVGNIRMYLFDSIHTQTSGAKEDTFYIDRAHRKGFTAIRFWQYMERCVAALGAKEIETDSKVVNQVHRLNKYLGYTHVANKFVKIIKD